jgi:hypothetical protein
MLLQTPDVVSAEEAHALVLHGEAAGGMRVDGSLEFRDEAGLRRLPPGLKVRRLRLVSCPNLEALPDGLDVRSLEMTDCPRITTLPSRLHCYEILARRSNLSTLDGDLLVDYRLDLGDGKRLTRLPARLKAGALILSGCTALETLPEGLEVCFLDLQGCLRLTRWPRAMTLHIGRLSLAGCARVTQLPPGLRRLAHLDVSGCPGVTRLPPGLRIDSSMEVAGSGLKRLPRSLKGVRVRWRGVEVGERVAFRPETLAADDILGFEWFIRHAGAETLDVDHDPGGERRLLRVAVPDDEPLVCVSVACPSTERRYLLRVPPATTTCRQATAWMAGFDDPDDYRPLIET